jgi:S1-C subfamily serine protease
MDVATEQTLPGLEAPAKADRLPSAWRRALVPLLASLLGAAVGATATLAIGAGPGSQSGVVRVASPAAAGGGATGAAAVAAQVLPSVVRVDISGQAGGPFGRRLQGTGSGVIYRSDGYILTNAHVVDGADTVQVTLTSGEKLTARVVGTATPSDDIALLKVDKTGLTPATLASTSDVRVGDLAVAVGSPFGLQGTVTAGVISALHRNVDLGQGERFADAIQTDAPINPGNSGGALAASNGAVIGINTAIVSGSAGNVGVGFAIPIDIARRDADQIIATGHASRPFLGISGESVPGGGGALVQAVSASGPAARAGIQTGDVIVQVDDARIDSMDELIAVISRLEVGREVGVTVVRNGSRSTLRVTLGSQPGG